MCITQQLIFWVFEYLCMRALVCVCACWCVHNMRVCVFAMADWAEKSAGWRVGEPPKLEGPTNQPPKPHLPAQLVRQTQEMRRTPNQSQTQTTHLFPFIPSKIIKYIPRSWIMDCSYLNQKQQRRRTKTHEFVCHAWARSAQFDQSMKKKQQMLVLVKSFWKSALFILSFVQSLEISRNEKLNDLRVQFQLSKFS